MEDNDALQQSAVDARAAHQEELNMAVAASNERAAAAEANAQKHFVAAEASLEAKCLERNHFIEGRAGDAIAAAQRRANEAVQRIADMEVCGTNRSCSLFVRGTYEM